MKTLTQIEWSKLCETSADRQSLTGIVKWNDGSISHFKNGLEHREDGPAYETPRGYKEWCIEGALHRLDGPARIYSDFLDEYWINGIRCSKEQHAILKDFLEYKQKG